MSQVVLDVTVSENWGRRRQVSIGYQNERTHFTHIVSNYIIKVDEYGYYNVQNQEMNGWIPLAHSATLRPRDRSIQ